MRTIRRKRVAVASMAVALAAAGSAAAFQQLPPTDQVNNDVPAGINPALGVSGEDPTNADVVGGALVAGKPAVPWAIFRQHETADLRHDQIFSRSFASPGAWTTRGNGTVGGRSECEPDVQRLAELRPRPGRRGAGDRLRRNWPYRAVGDVVREHAGTCFGNNNIFASRFDDIDDANREVDLRRSGSRERRQRTVPVPVAEHPHQPGRGEPVGGRRIGRRRRRSPARGSRGRRSTRRAR